MSKPIPGKILLTGLIGLVVSSATTLVAQTTPAAMPSICTRACWGARAPACQPGNINALTRAIVHHTAGTGDWTTDYEAGKAKVRGVQNYHIDSAGFCDISYHFLVNAGGHIYEGRNGAIAGLPKGYHDCCNVDSFAFNVMGYYHPPYNQTFTQASLDSLQNVIAWRMPAGWSPYGASGYCGTTVGVLDGHRRVAICNNGSAGGSACPGDGIYNAFITDNRNGGPIRTGVASRRTPPPPVPTILTASAGQRMKGDFNGDGREDVVVLYNYGNDSSTLFTFLSNGNTFAAPAAWWSSGAGNWNATRSQWVAGDFNYDGKSDVAAMYDYDNASRIFVFLSTGSSFQNAQSWWYSGIGNWEAKRTKLVAGDFNGFGVCDIGALYDYDNASATLFVFLSTKTSFLNPAGWVSWGPGGFDAKRAKLVSGDFDGNGKSDIAAAYGYDNSATGLWVFQSQGSPGSSFGQSLWWQSGAGNWDWARSQFVSGDFNGDGKRDVAATYDYGNDSTSLFVFPSNGASFNGSSQWWTSGTGNWRAPNSKWLTGDFSGDGKTDIGALYNYGNSTTSMFTFGSTGSAFAAPLQWWSSGIGNWDWNRSTTF